MGFFFKKQKNKTPQKSWQRDSSKAYSVFSKKDAPPKAGKFSRFLFWLLLLGFLGICAYLLFFSPFLDIEAISVEGNQDIPSEEIVARVEKAIEGRYYNYFSRKNFFLVSKKNIDNALRSNFDRLEVASIEKKFPKTILIKVTERKAELVWCSGGVCYLVDKSGLAYSGVSGNDEELRNSGFLTVIDDSARPIEIGKTKIDAAYIFYLESINDLLKSDPKLDPIESYHTPGMASGEISARTTEGWTLKISSETSSEETKKIIETVFEKELAGEQRMNLDYLDLRVRGKVYYKMR